jgi:hypothetical protein
MAPHVALRGRLERLPRLFRRPGCLRVSRVHLGLVDEWKWPVGQPRRHTGSAVVRLGDRRPAPEDVDPQLPRLISLLRESGEG